VTHLGRQMSALPLAPSLARVLLAAKDSGTVEILLPVVAMLCVEQVFVRPGGTARAKQAAEVHADLFAAGYDDFTNLLLVYELWRAAHNQRDWSRAHFIHFRALVTANKITQQLAHLVKMRPAKRSDESTVLVEYRAWQGALHDRRPSDVPPTIPQTVVAAIRCGLCQGFFQNVARGPGPLFHTMDGHASAVSVHPSSSLFSPSSGGLGATSIDWVLFHEVVWTSRPYMRTITPIKYEWVKSLLPKLHEVDVNRLSTTGKVNETSDIPVPRSLVDEASAMEETTISTERRTTSASIAAARERYLQRKRKRAADSRLS